MNTASFWQKNQVLITSIASALIMFLQPVIDSGQEIDWKVIGLGALAVVAGIIGNEFRGKGQSIAGILGAIAYSYMEVMKTGELSWDRFILSVVIGIAGLAAPPFKSIGYEKTDIIKQAKKEGELDVPTPIGPKPDKIINE
jgi:uncharacterized protein YcfJ